MHSQKLSDVAGNLIRTEFPNQVVEIHKYDERHRLTFLKNVQIDPDSGEEILLSSYSYTLNDVGHRVAVQEADGREVSYEYDDLYRLTKEIIGEQTIAYTYDSVGNRLTRDDSVKGLTTYRTHLRSLIGLEVSC